MDRLKIKVLEKMNPSTYHLLHELWHCLKINCDMTTFYPDFRDFVYANRNIDLATLQLLYFVFQKGMM